VIRQNAHKYSVSAMCKCLKVARSTYYYEATVKADESELETQIERIFHDNTMYTELEKSKKNCKNQIIRYRAVALEES